MKGYEYTPPPPHDNLPPQREGVEALLSTIREVQAMKVGHAFKRRHGDWHRGGGRKNGSY